MHDNKALVETLVHALRWEAEGVVGIDLIPAAGGSELPAFAPGAHVDLHLSPGVIRSYSICSSPGELHRYRLAVKLEEQGRGGSSLIHQKLRPGQKLHISSPRNLFPLHDDSTPAVLIAGGIGITPIWCMLQELVAHGRPVDLIYAARSRQCAAFLDEIRKLTDGKVNVIWHFDDEEGRPVDLLKLLENRDPGHHYYCCGPGPMLDAFVHASQTLGLENFHIERFAAQPVVDEAPSGDRLLVHLQQSGVDVQVEPGQSILDALIDAGLAPSYSCQQGICGACETTVIEGDIEHRDSVLTEQERQSGRTMMICVSTCASGRLVLDL